jgi:hypothetical protein
MWPVVKPNLEQSGSWIGIGGMAVALFLYCYSALALPGLVTSLLLPLVWIVLLVLGLRWFMSHPYRVIALPAAAIALWFAVMLA